MHGRHNRARRNLGLRHFRTTRLTYSPLKTQTWLHSLHSVKTMWLNDQSTMIFIIRSCSVGVVDKVRERDQLERGLLLSTRPASPIFNSNSACNSSRLVATAACCCLPGWGRASPMGSGAPVLPQERHHSPFRGRAGGPLYLTSGKYPEQQAASSSTGAGPQRGQLSIHYQAGPPKPGIACGFSLCYLAEVELDGSMGTHLPTPQERRDRLSKEGKARLSTTRSVKVLETDKTNSRTGATSKGIHSAQPLCQLTKPGNLSAHHSI